MGISCKTLPEALIKAAGASDSDRGYTFVSDDGSAELFCSFGELASQVSRYGAALVQTGLTKGEKVALILPKSEEFVFTFLGAMHAGVVPVPVAPPISIARLGPYLEHMKNIIEASEASFLITSLQIKRLMGSLLGGTLRAIRTVEEIQVSNEELPLASLREDDLAFIQFTSGSTTNPRGVSLTHKNLMANAHCIMNLGLQVTPEDIGCSWLPLFHDMGLIGFVLSPLLTRTPVVLMPPMLFLRRPVEWLKMITHHRGTATFGPNFAYGLCLKRIREHELEGIDLSSLRVAGCGAEPIHHATLQSFAKRFSAVGFREEAFLPCYGMAESTLAVTFIGLEEPMKGDTVSLERLTREGVAAPVKSGESDAVTIVCCGKPFEGHGLRIVDSHGKDCPQRNVGEIVIRGPSVMSRYYNNREATEGTLKDGWLHTGDLGYLAGGELYVCGRVKDVIIVAGKNYHPTDIEWTVSEVEGVRKGNVIAFGLQDVGGRDERVVVCAETKEAGRRYPELEKTIRARVIKDLGIKIGDVVMLKPGSLLKTSSGKLQRTKTKELYLNGTLDTPRKGQDKLSLIKHWAKSQWSFLKHRTD